MNQGEGLKKPEVYSLALSKYEKPIKSETDLKKAKERLKQQFSQLPNEILQKKNQFLCCKMYNSQKGETVKFYKCQQCAKAYNSIICIDCYEGQKHAGHSVEEASIDEGCCDCGDRYRWAQEGFCSNHTFDLKKNGKNVWTAFEEKIKIICNNSYAVLCLSFNQFKLFKNKLDQRKHEITPEQLEYQKKQMELAKIYVDDYGQYFLSQLDNINEGRYYINHITIKWLRTIYKFEKKLRYISSQQVKKQMMKFYELPKTSNMCVKLFLKLFYCKPYFRKEVAILHFSYCFSFSDYSISNFKELSAQLFSNSQLIKNLVNQKLISPLFYVRFLPDSPQAEPEEQMKIFSQCYQTYYHNLQYFLNLKVESCRIYWNYFVECCYKNSFFEFTFYADVFSDEKTKETYRALANRHIYKIEELAMLTFMKIVQKMLATSEQKIVEKVLPQHFKAKFESERLEVKLDLFKSQKHNLFLTDFRIQSILLFVYVFNLKGRTDQQSEQNYSPLQKKTMSPKQEKKQKLFQLADLLKISLAQLKEYCFFLVRYLLQYFFRISSFSNEASNQNDEGFFKTYYQSSHPNILISLDFHLFKFAYSSLEILLGQCLQEKQRIKQKISPIINGYLSSLNNQFFQKVEQNDQGGLESCIEKLHSFVNLIEQARYSDLPEMVLLNQLSPHLFQETYQQRFLGFYSKISKLMRENGIDKMRKVIRFLFFKEEEAVFKRFVNFQDSKQSMQIESSIQDMRQEEEKVNLQYFYSLRFKLNSNVQKLIWVNCSTNLPFADHPQLGSGIFEETNHLTMVSNWLKKMIRIPECHDNIINEVTKQLRRMEMLERSNKIKEYLIRPYLELYYQQISRQKSKSILSFLQEDVRSYWDINQVLFKQEQINKLPSVEQTKSLDLEDKQVLTIKQFCMLQQKCQNGNGPDFYWLGFAKETRIYSIITFKTNEAEITFSACGHFVHKKCLEQLLNRYQAIPRCKKCGNNYNLLIPKSQDTERGQNPLQSLKNQFFFIGPSMTLQISINSVNLFRSLCFFLLSCLVVDEYTYFRNKLPFYRALFHHLKQSSEEIKTSILKAIQSQIQQIERLQEDIPVTIYFQRQFFKSLRNKKICEEQIIPPRIKKTSAKAINQILRFFKGDDQITKLRLCINSNNEQNYLKLSQLSDNLQRLCQEGHCSFNERHIKLPSYYKCLLPHPNSPYQTFFCQRCLNQHLISHIKQHHGNQILMVQTSTGNPHYFYLAEIYPQQHRLMSYVEESLYQSRTSKPYLLGQKLDKNDFFLCEKRLKSLLYDFTSWNLISEAKEVEMC